MTNLLLMGVQGSAMIVAILVLRALLLDRLPKATFCALWVLVVARLLVPLFVANPLGLWGLASHLQPHRPGGGEGLGVGSTAASGTAAPKNTGVSTGAASSPGGVPSSTTVSSSVGVSPLPVPTEQAPDLPQVAAIDPATFDPNSSPATPAGLLSTLAHATSNALPWWAWVWIVGSSLCLLGFAVLYLHGWLRFKASVPVTCPQAMQWLREHPLRRPLSIRCCAAVNAPLTYGILSPVVLVPPAFNWDDSRTVNLVLAHEYAHVKRFDALWKLALVLAACVHWFNPLAWVMYVVANHDIELSCDARVARRLLPGQRASYARMLLETSNVEGARIAPLASAFAKSSIEERVVSVVKYRPTSWGACIASAAVLIAVPTALATSAPAPSESAEPAAVQTGAGPLAEGATPGIAVEGRPITSHEYSDEEWDALEMLYRYARLGDSLTSSPQSGIGIVSFRRAIPAALDGLDAEDLLARLASDGWLQRQINSNTMATFLELALVPLASDDWESYEFVGARSVGEPVQGILTFSFTFAYGPESIALLSGTDASEPEYVPVAYYLNTARSNWNTLNTMLDNIASSELSDPDRVMEIIDTYQVPNACAHRSCCIDARYSYQARTDNGSWQVSPLVGTIHVVPNVDNPSNGSEEYEHGLETGTMSVELSPDAVNPLITNFSYLNYESLGITRDPITGKLFYEGQPVRLFIDGYTGGAPGAQADQISFYYTDPEGTLDLRTEFDYFGRVPVDSSVGQAFQEFRTPIYGIAEMAEEEARAVAEFFSPLYEQVYPVHTAEELYGPSGEDPGVDAFDTNLPIVSSLLAMEPSQLLGYLEDNGYTYDEAEKAFRRDRGTFGKYTGSIVLHALSAPDEDGYRGLSPDQLRADEPVEAVTATLFFDTYVDPIEGDAAAATLEFLREREENDGTDPIDFIDAIAPIAWSAFGCEINGREAVGSIYISGNAGISVSCSHLDYRADAYHREPRLEDVAGFAIPPNWTNPEVWAIIEEQRQR